MCILQFVGTVAGDAWQLVGGTGCKAVYCAVLQQNLVLRLL